MNMQRRRFWFWAGMALAAGLVLRLWFIKHMAVIAGDSLVYGDIAQNWLQHGVYGFTETVPGTGMVIRPTLIRLPGYPMFLAVCFRLFGVNNYHAVLYVQAAIDLLTCWLASALAGRLFGNRAAMVVLWLAAICPFTANYVAAALTETLTLCSIALAFYSFARWQNAGSRFNRWIWVVAVALSWSLLLRPEQSVFAVGVLTAMLWRSLATRECRSRPLRSAWPVLTAALCVILPLVPWTVRNWRTFHVFQPLAPHYANDPGELAPLGFSCWYRTWAIDFKSTQEVYWNYSGDRIELADLPSRAFDAGSPQESQSLRDRTAALLVDYNATTRVTADVTPAIDARFAALAAERIHAHPMLYYVGLPSARLLDMVLRPRAELMNIPLDWWRWKEYRGRTTFSFAYAGVNFAYMVLGFLGFYIWWRSDWDVSGSGQITCRELALAMTASLILRAAVLLAIDNSEPRYTLEFFPVLFVWAGALLATPMRLASVDQPGKR